VLCCETTPLSKLTCFVSFHRVTCPIQLYDRSNRTHTFIHSCIHTNTFTYSYIHSYTTSLRHSRVCRPELCSVPSNSVPTYHRVKRQSFVNEQLPALIQINQFQKCHPQHSCSSDATYQFQKCHPQRSCSCDVTNQVNFKSVIPNIAGQGMSRINVNFKSVIPNIAVQVMSRININFKSAIPSTTVQVMSHINFKSAIPSVTVQVMPLINQFQKCRPQRSCSNDATYQIQKCHPQ